MPLRRAFCFLSHVRSAGLTAIVAVALTAGLLGFTRQTQGAATDLETPVTVLSHSSACIIFSRTSPLSVARSGSQPLRTCHNQVPNSIITLRLAKLRSWTWAHARSRHSALLEGLPAWSHRLVTSVRWGRSCLARRLFLTCRGRDRRCPGDVARHGDYCLGACDPSVYARKGALWLASLIPVPTVRLAQLFDLVTVVGGLVILIAAF